MLHSPDVRDHRREEGGGDATGPAVIVPVVDRGLTSNPALRASDVRVPVNAPAAAPRQGNPAVHRS